ncbi:phosphate/phosphite/phosphonate ABC transporter substrate-binding protein [Thioalkalivibrio thiocyanodenitrificans]|uniref:phosphate/phosphite/phosphonate ABC transporter substrate-binding protein n=1 Tax=Thioalkalivibrio thiocyanodenitrificans TaxID=243063 RepID=UPI0003791EC2|nr:phosphate/phosphite/phosphonate ABC transporter substrate-binding protein [Thioalkalivibrio thiocyanodenitrificans]
MRERQQEPRPSDNLEDPARRAGTGFPGLTLLCGLLLLCAPAAAEQADTSGPLRFGLLPFASPVSLFQRFAPLRDYLADRLGTSFELESARSFAVHVARIEAGEYDLVLTAPHFVLIALDSGHYHLIAGHRSELSAAFVVARDDQALTLHDLAERTIATPPPEALITMVGKEYLLDYMDPSDRLPTFVAYPSHNAAIHAVTSGLAGAAIASINAARHEINQNLAVRILEESDRFPGIGVLAHRRLTERLRDDIADVLITMADQADGSDVLRQMDYAGYRSTSAQTYEPFRPILTETRRHLEAPPDTP